MERLAAEYQETIDLARHGIERPAAEAVKLDRFHADHRAAWVPGKKPGSVAAFDRAWRLFLAFCAGRRVETVRAVDASVCRAFLAERRSLGAHASADQERGLIAPAWQSAVRDGVVAANPWRLERVPGRPRRERPDYWDPGELARLLEACDPWERDVAVVGVHTGLRAENLLTLEWSEVKLDAGRIELPARKMKSGKPLSLPLASAASEVLARLAGRARGRFVFRRPDGAEGPPNKGEFAYRMIRARRRAKLPAKRQPCHILRHTFATHAARSVPLPVLQQWLGHASITQTMKYVQVSEAESARHMASFSLGTDDAGRSGDGSASGPP